MKKTIAFICILFTGVVLQASGKAASTAAQAANAVKRIIAMKRNVVKHHKPVFHAFERLVGTPRVRRAVQNIARLTKPATVVAASPAIQTVSDKAHAAMGTVPVPAFKRSGKGADIANADIHGVFVNEKIKNYSPEMQKFLLRHEAVHSKYLDSSVTAGMFITWIGTGAAATGFFLRKLGAKALLIAPFVFIGAMISKVGIDFYHEERADREAALSIQCAQCIKNIAAGFRHRKTQSPKGYLSYDQFMEISNQFKKDNCYCANHAPESL